MLFSASGYFKYNIIGLVLVSDNLSLTFGGGVEGVDIAFPSSLTSREGISIIQFNDSACRLE